MRGKCPIELSGKMVLDSLEVVGKQMRMLRREIRKCQLCRSYREGCPILMDLENKIEQALRDVNEEMGITLGE